jgi:hypothetical protein
MLFFLRPGYKAKPILVVQLVALRQDFSEYLSVLLSV